MAALRRRSPPFFAASFNGSINLGAGALASMGKNDVLVAKLSNVGAVVWNRRYGDANDQNPGGVGVTLAGEPSLAGWAQGTIDFGTGPLTSAGGYDIFIASLSQ